MSLTRIEIISELLRLDQCSLLRGWISYSAVVDGAGAGPGVVDTKYNIALVLIVDTRTSGDI